MERPVRYFCIDCEASGQIPGFYNLLSIGAVAVVEGERGRLVPGPSFYVELQPVYPDVDPDAMKVCGLDLEHLKVYGESPADALRALCEFVEEHTPPKHESVFVGHNAVFDWMMIRWYLHAFEVDNPFGWKALDTKALAMGALNIPWLNSSKETLREMLRLPLQDPDKVHRADYDAWYQALILIRLLEFQDER